MGAASSPVSCPPCICQAISWLNPCEALRFPPRGALHKASVITYKLAKEGFCVLASATGTPATPFTPLIPRLPLCKPLPIFSRPPSLLHFSGCTAMGWHIVFPWFLPHHNAKLLPITSLCFYLPDPRFFLFRVYNCNPPLISAFCHAGNLQQPALTAFSLSGHAKLPHICHSFLLLPFPAIRSSSHILLDPPQAASYCHPPYPSPSPVPLRRLSPWSISQGTPLLLFPPPLVMCPSFCMPGPYL